MPAVQLRPPAFETTCQPLWRALPARTTLFRVHRTYRSPLAFNTRLAGTDDEGGRFDGTSDDPYPYYYAALTARTALFEAIFAESGTDIRHPAQIPRQALRHRAISALRTTCDLDLISLDSGNPRPGYGNWLSTAGREHFPETRRHAHRLRALAPWAHGLIWQSRRRPHDQALILFGDRCNPGSLQLLPAGTSALDDERGNEMLRRTVHTP